MSSSVPSLRSLRPASLEPLEPAAPSSQKIVPVHIGSDRLVIEFGVESQLYDMIYDITGLKQIHFFQKIESSPFIEAATGKCKLPEIDPAIFKAIYSILVEEKPFYEAIPKELLSRSTFFEEFKKTIDYLHPGEPGEVSDTIIQKMKQSLPSLITLEIAEKILTHYRENKPEFTLITKAPSNGSSGSLDKPAPASHASKEEKKAASEIAGEHPFGVMIAKKIVIQSRLMPRTDAVELFEDIYDKEVALEFAEQSINKSRFFLARHCTISHQQHHAEQVRSLNFKIETSRRLIDHLNERLIKNPDFTKLTFSQKVTLASYINDEDPEIKAFAAEAKIEVNAFKQKVIRALQGSETNALRADLIEPFMCLLDFYGFTVCSDENSKFPFKLEYPLNLGTQCFRYALNNNSAYDLETEILDSFRGKRSVFGNKRFIERRTAFTKPQTPEIQEIRKKIMPTLMRWPNNDEVNTLVKQTLIDHFKWGARIAATDVCIEVIDLSAHFKSEKITVGFRNSHRAITLNLWDLKTIYTSDGALIDIPSIAELEADKGTYTSELHHFGDSYRNSFPG